MLSLSNDSSHSSQGQEAGPSAELVSQMMEEALGQNDQTSDDKERSGYERIICMYTFINCWLS